jgi:tripeptidyl-peptidase-1
MVVPPYVVSVSYGFNVNQVSLSSAKDLCNLFSMLGSKGVSVIVASGDGGGECLLLPLW